MSVRKIKLQVPKLIPLAPLKADVNTPYIILTTYEQFSEKDNVT
jgi:hypothetical protein